MPAAKRTLLGPACRFDDEGAKQRATELSEENAALKQRLTKALETAANASSVGGSAIAAAVGNGVLPTSSQRATPLSQASAAAIMVRVRVRVNLAHSIAGTECTHSFERTTPAVAANQKAAPPVLSLTCA